MAHVIMYPHDDDGYFALKQDGILYKLFILKYAVRTYSKSAISVKFYGQDSVKF